MIYSQSCVKDLERDETCPFRWKSLWIDKNPELRLSNEHMVRGRYFEQLVLGKSALPEVPAEMPLLKNGGKSADQIRIEDQAKLVKKLFIDNENDLKLRFETSQLSLLVGDESGVIDLILRDEINIPVIVDLKLTKNLSSTFSKYGYGNEWSEMDQLQLTHYEHLYKTTYDVIPRTALLVVDYSPKMRIEFNEIITSQKKKEERSYRFSAAKQVVELYNKHGWIKIPSSTECSLCPLKCNERIQKDENK